MLFLFTNNVIFEIGKISDAFNAEYALAILGISDIVICGGMNQLSGNINLYTGYNGKKHFRWVCNLLLPKVYKEEDIMLKII